VRYLSIWDAVGEGGALPLREKAIQ